MTGPRTRRPTGAAPWMRLLLTGEPGTAGAWMAAEFTGDARLVASYWLELEPDSSGDVYAAAPGADFELLDHDGTWAEIYGQLDAAWQVARQVAQDGGMPSALVVHGMSAEWAMLSALADLKARRRTAAALDARGLDPEAAFTSEVRVEVDPDLWTLVGARHNRFMGKILTWPGPVILIAREQRDRNGRWALKAQEQLPFAVTAWVRLARGEQPEILALNTPKRYQFTSTKRRQLRAKFSLAALAWEWSGCTPDTPMPALRTLDADQVMPGEQLPARPAPAPPAPAQPVAPVAIVPDEPPAPMPADEIDDLVTRWLELDSRVGVADLFARTPQRGTTAGDTDVARLLKPEERALFAVPDNAALSLYDLAVRTARHVTRTGAAVRPHGRVGAA